MIVLQAFFVRSFSGSLLFLKAPERVQIMKKVNRNNGTIDVTTVGGRIKKLRTKHLFVLIWKVQSESVIFQEIF